MPVLDVDGGLNFQNYNPSILTGRTESIQPNFYFGGSQVPVDLGLEKLKSQSVNKIKTKVVKRFAKK